LVCRRSSYQLHRQSSLPRCNPSVLTILIQACKSYRRCNELERTCCSWLRRPREQVGLPAHKACGRHSTCCRIPSLVFPSDP
jgi:hypothetical protein